MAGGEVNSLDLAWKTKRLREDGEDVDKEREGDRNVSRKLPTTKLVAMK